MKQFRNPAGVHPPLAGYTHQIEVTGIKKLLFLSGQIGMDSEGNLPENPLDQLELAIENVLINLRAADMDVTDITKLTIYLVDTDMDRASRGRILREKLGEHAPCMTLVFVVALANPSIKAEIDAFAVSDM